jgi:hypothetical protein
MSSCNRETVKIEISGAFGCDGMPDKIFDAVEGFVFNLFPETSLDTVHVEYSVVCGNGGFKDLCLNRSKSSFIRTWNNPSTIKKGPGKLSGPS